MRIIISPAKKMNEDLDSLACHGLPMFLPEAETLLGALRHMSPSELKTLWRCSDAIAALNVERIQNMDLRRRLTPAVLAYEGIQYRYLAPDVFTAEELNYLETHLRILSGFYGLLRPFDGVTPYRLEMGAKWSVGGHKDLYDFWGDRVARALLEETDCIVNLASREYSLCVSPYVPSGVRFLTCVFADRKGDKLVEKGTLCKMARGEMVRYLAEHRADTPEAMRGFDRLGYRFDPDRSDDETYVFWKEVSQHAERWDEGA